MNRAIIMRLEKLEEKHVPATVYLRAKDDNDAARQQAELGPAASNVVFIIRRIVRPVPRAEDRPPWQIRALI